MAKKTIFASIGTLVLKILFFVRFSSQFNGVFIISTADYSSDFLYSSVQFVKQKKIFWKMDKSPLLKKQAVTIIH